jgi:type VI secretion system protein VasJ
MSTIDEAPILELGKTPIAGPAPAGADAADDPDYILVGAEMSKADRVDTGPPEWHEVERAASDVLRLKSKDVEMACSLGLAMFRKSGYAGLSASLAMIGEMLNNFWDGMFPERLRRRKNTIESLCERFTDGGWFADDQHKPNDYDALDACLQRIEAIEATLKAKMPDEPPDFGKFKRALKDYAAQRPKADAPPPVQPATTGGAATTTSAAPAATGGVAVGGEINDRSGAVKTVLAAATYIRKADMADPLSYALVRAVKWSTATLPPEAARNQIDPPDKATVETLTFQFAEAQWENLLKNAEAAFRAGHPLWLDVQRYACTAMGALGANYQRAREAIMAALAGLVRRLGSSVFELQFRGGAALTSGETKLWIESEVAPPTGSKKSGGHGGGANGKLTEASDKARELAGTGKLKEAVEILTEGLNAASQKRDRLLWQLCIAQLCCDAQRLPQAAHMLDLCSKEIRQHGIDDWEPSLAVEVAQLLYRCRRGVAALEKQPSPEQVEALREAYAWLCQLDPMAAFSVEPPGK